MYWIVKLDHHTIVISWTKSICILLFLFPLPCFGGSLEEQFLYCIPYLVLAVTWMSSNTAILEPRAEYSRTQLDSKNSQVERAGRTLNVKNLQFKEFPILNLSKFFTSGLVLAQIGSGAALAHRELGAHDQRLLLGHGVTLQLCFFVIERKISTSLSQLMKRGLQGQGCDLGR